ncbi:MAG: hypothetical protein HFE83_06940 [Lachnospiraceae bacterium]|jgi:ESS family glutamate:Na+ symporter|nr:hypothetical protein [Lachnospiraceae bacterium]
MSVSKAVTLILKTFSVLSVLLFAGFILRSKIRLFQRLYLPACVIGGAIGLLLGPNVFNLIPFPEEMMSVVSALPNVLFTPIVVALPVCGATLDRSSLKKQKPVLVMAAMLCMIGALQFAIGLLVNAVFSVAGVETYRAFGLELAQGFIGGHGQTGATGSMLKAMDQPYWEIASGVNSTTATVGMIGGIIIGTTLINVSAKKGYTRVVKSAAEVLVEMRTGIYPRTADRPDMGTQTTVTNSIESLTLHLGLLLVATGGGYIVQKQVSRLGFSLLGAIATWIYALLVMYVLWFVICKLKADYLFDEKVKNTVTGLLSDYLITAAIMSIPVKVVMSYWLPMAAICVIALIFVPGAIYLISKRFAGDYWFEKCLGPIGCCCGVFVTGMLLIKMADPDLQTPALNDYSLSYTLHNFFLIPFVPFIFAFTVSNGAMSAGLLSLSLAAMFFALVFVFGRKKI